MREYKCTIYMVKAMEVVDRIRPSMPDLAEELETALRRDQHDLYHDGEFYDGCDICDQERKEYA